MKKLIIPIMGFALAAPAFAEDVNASLETRAVPVAYAELAAGQNQNAVDQILADHSVAINDPSRLLNLGTAYARLGQIDKAEAMFRAAMRSDIRYNVELGNGQMIDSYEAARVALSRLDRRIAAR
jgi:pentatricopeptide repeat protein